MATPPTQTVQRAPSASSQLGFDEGAGFVGEVDQLERVHSLFDVWARRAENAAESLG